MSYEQTSPAFYQMLQPGTPYHAGAPGWSRAPFPGWGQNPALRGPARLGVHGCAGECGCGGCGQVGGGVPWGTVALVGGAALLGWVILRSMRSYQPNRRHRRNAKWSRAYKNRLPDAAFLYIAPGGRKVRRGGKTYTIPKDLRKFPVENPDGSINLPHLRNAISRIPRSTIPEARKSRLQTVARKKLALATGRPYAKLAKRAARGKRRRRAA